MKGKQCYFKAYKALLASLEYIGHNFYPLALQKRNVFRATVSTWQHDPYSENELIGCIYTRG